jgi:thiosulfate dehydrogenase
MSAVGVALLPVDAGLEAQGRLPMDPFAEGVHPVPTMAARIREGYRIGRNTPELAPDFTGNALSCFNCHLNGGQKEGALPLVGAAATFPQYRSRNDALVTLEERIAGCFRRSMNGTAPPRNHPVALALSAYITWISRGQPLGERPAFAGRNAIPEARRLAIEELDLKRGRERFRLLCAGCHGMDGQGVALPQGMPGPLWGPGSWNDGAGAGRIWKLAGFIRHAMPLNQPGIVDDADAQHISAWINSHPRPEFATKAADWPGGGRPADAVYDTLVFPRHPLMERRERGEAQPERPLAPAPRR